MTKRDKFSLTITVVLAAVLILLVLNNSRKAKEKTQQRRKKIISSNLLQRQKTAGAPVSAGANITPISYQVLQEQAKKLKLKRDPFTQAQLAVSPESLSAIKLSGIIWDGKEPKAVINNVIVGIGGKIDGSTVIDIKQDSVILNDGTEDIILNLAY